ncbi:MAG: thiamine S protein [Methanolinea sp.]|nr:thiamine S protein [Methanolinea sp.]
MGAKCRFRIIPGEQTVEYTGAEGTTYEDALLSIGIIPDTVLILHGGKSLPQDEVIREEEVDIISTCSRG